MNQIKLYPDVASMTKVMPRIETLYLFVYELAQCFHANEETLFSIKTGIFENQILESINLKYINKSGEIVAGLTIKIDWDKHHLLAQTESGKELKIDMSKSIVDNIVGWRKYVVAHVDGIMRQFDAYNVKSTYCYRRSITENETVYQQARDIMHHVMAAEPTPSAINSTLQSELNYAFMQATANGEKKGDAIKRSLGCGVLEEVKVEMSYKSKK